MSKQTKTHIKKDVALNVFLNVVLNAGISWMLLKGGETLIWGGDKGFVGDLLATAFLMPFIVTLIMIAVQRKKVRAGKRDAVALNTGAPLMSLLARFPRSLFKNGLLFGGAGMLILAPITLLGLWIVGVETFSPGTYSVFKGLWAGVIAGILVPMMILVGLRQGK
ncbi:hypothetical protein [Ferrimonas pelagia]